MSQLEPSSQAELPPSDADRLSTLPNDLLGKVFSFLRELRDPVVVDESYCHFRGQNSRRCLRMRSIGSDECASYKAAVGEHALLQTCKAIRSSPACLAQINTLNLYLDEDKHGSMAAQLCAVPRGTRISRVRIAGCKYSEAQCVSDELGEPESGGRRSFVRDALEPERLHDFAQSAAHSTSHRLQLQDITDVILGKSCSVWGKALGEPSTDEELFLDALLAAFPSMVNLKIGSSFGSPALPTERFMTCQSELKLKSLSIDPSQTNGVVLCKDDCAVIASISSLESLSLTRFYKVTDIACLSSLTLLTSLRMSVMSFSDLSPLSNMTSLSSLTLTGRNGYWSSKGKRDPPGLLQMLSGCTNLQVLCLGGLETGAVLRLPVLRRLELMHWYNENLMPCLDLLPALQSLRIENWKVEGSPSDIGTMLAHKSCPS